MHWTKEVEEALLDGVPGVKKYKVKCDKQLDDIIIRVRTKLEKLQKKIINALIVIDVHALKVIVELIE